ncbi:hypothetical protein ACFX2C_017097 [Malus domestica]
MKRRNIHIFLLSIFLVQIFFLGATTGEELPISRNAGLRDSSHTLHYKQRQLLYDTDHHGSRGVTVTAAGSLVFENPRLRSAYTALQAWKRAMVSDPWDQTSNWVGSDVCKYTGVFCAQAPDDPSVQTVAGIDLNHADIAGFLPEELGLLLDIALFHINSNRFCGKVPKSFNKLKLLFELDLSNNRFAGEFPDVVLQLPALKFLDLRFNEFEGKVPKELFDKDLDAIFINHNRFSFQLPDNFGKSPVSVIVLANNNFHGCVPASLGNMSKNLNELVLANNGFHSCLPKEIGMLKNVRLFDVSHNRIVGELPKEIVEMESLEQLNVAHNMLRGTIPEGQELLAEKAKAENLFAMQIGFV